MLDTSGFLGDRAGDALLDATDLVLLDIKSGDPGTYRRVTGTGRLASTVRFGRRLAEREAMFSGSVADGLMRGGAGAYLLVIGNRRRGAIGRTRTGDVPSTVARRAGCPVAVIPLDGPAAVPTDGDRLA